MGRSRDKEQKVVLSFELEKRNAEQAEKGIKDLDKSIQGLTDELDALDNSASVAADSMRNIGKGAADQRREIEQSIDALKRQRKELKETAAGTAGLGPLQEIFTVIDDFANLGEQLPKMASGARDLQASLASGTSAAAGMAGSVATTTTAATAATPAIGGVGISLGAIAAAALPIAAALGAIALAFKVATEAIEEGRARVASAVDGQLTYFELVETGTQESIQSALAQLETERNINQKKVEFLKAQLEQMSLIEKILAGGEIEDRLEELQSQLNESEAAINAHNAALQDEEVIARSATQTTQAQTQATGQQVQASQRAEKQEQARAQAAQEQAQAMEEAKRKEEERTRAIKQAQEQITKIQEQAERRRQDIFRQTSRRFADLARTFAQGAEDARRQLERDQAALVEQFGEDRTKIIIDAQRAEEDAAKTHQENLKRIRIDAERSERDLIRNRDFAGLIAAREQAAEQMSDENKRFIEERKAANDRLRVQLKDLRTNFLEQRRERLRNFRIQAEDTRRNNLRQIAELRLAQRRQLEDLRRSTNQQLAERRRQLQGELNMLQQFGVNVTRFFNMLNARNAQLAAARAGGRGTITRRRALGGFLPAGTPSLVNEQGQESFRTGNQEFMLPAGRGTFIPDRGGMVRPSGSGVSVLVDMNGVTVNDPKKIGKIAGDKVERGLIDALTRLVS
jgi:hypothetical protein